MFSGSFFSSKYKGGDGVWRHTAFDRGYIVNMLGGKEWMLGRHYTVSYRINRRGLTHEFSIKHINCTGTKSYYGYEYAYREDTFKPMTFNLSLPNISYKLEF